METRKTKKAEIFILRSLSLKSDWQTRRGLEGEHGGGTGTFRKEEVGEKRTDVYIISLTRHPWLRG